VTYRDRLLTCPRCGKPLTRSTRRERWSCRACQGVAIEVAELVRQLAFVVPDLVPRVSADLVTAKRAAHEPALPCAVCGQVMEPVELQGVLLDRCYKDQLVWFDASELDRVIESALAEHHARKSWVQRLRELLFAR
jgi:Zn-finger nucleic acid-binding protein